MNLPVHHFSTAQWSLAPQFQHDDLALGLLVLVHNQYTPIKVSTSHTSERYIREHTALSGFFRICLLNASRPFTTPHCEHSSSCRCWPLQSWHRGNLMLSLLPVRWDFLSDSSYFLIAVLEKRKAFRVLSQPPHLYLYSNQLTATGTLWKADLRLCAHGSCLKNGWVLMFVSTWFCWVNEISNIEQADVLEMKIPYTIVLARKP